LNDEERSTLAERIQKRINEKHPHYQIIKRKDEIEKEFEGKMRTVDFELKLPS
jgi:hypothetical protein